MSNSNIKAGSVKDAAEKAAGEFSMDQLFALRRDVNGLEVFVRDLSEAKLEHKDATKKQIHESAVKLLKLAKEVDPKQMDDEEIEEINDQVEEDSAEFTDQLFDLVSDEDMAMEEKVKRVGELLSKFQERVEAKAIAKAKRHGIVEKMNHAKASVVAFIVGLPFFAALPASIQAKVKAAGEDVDLGSEELVEFSKKLIKQHTGEDLDTTDLMIALMHDSGDKVDKLIEGKEKRAEKGDEGGGIISKIVGLKSMLKNNAFAGSYGRFAKACGVSKMTLASVSMETVGAVRQSVSGITYADVLNDFDGDEKKAKKAWEYTSQLQTLCEWATDNGENISEILDEAIERLPNLSREDQEALKAKMQPDNLRVSQLSMAMFGDNDLQRSWLIKAPVYVARGLKFHKTFIGADAVKAKALMGYFTDVRMRGERLAYKSGITSSMSNLKLKSGLEFNMSGFKSVEEHFGKLTRDIEEAKFEGKMTSQHLHDRTRFIDTFHEGVKLTEKRFASISGELVAKGKVIDSIRKRGDLAGKTISQLGLDSKTMMVLEDVLGHGVSGKNALRAMEEAQGVFARQTRGILELQRTLNKQIAGVRGKLMTDVVTPFAEMSKKSGKFGKAASEASHVMKFGAKSTLGKIKYFGPKLAMPVFGIGASLASGIMGKQGFKKTALMVSEAAISFVPIVGSAMDIGLGIKGYDLAGNKLSTLERISYGAFGALGLAADLAGGFLLRGAMAAVVKGRRGMKVVNAIGKRRSIIFKGYDLVKGGMHAISKTRRIEKLEDAIKLKRVAKGAIEAKMAAGTASKMESFIGLRRLDRQILSGERKLSRLKRGVSMTETFKHGARGLKVGATKGMRYADRATMVLERVGLAAGLTMLISQGNVTPVDVVEGAVTGVAAFGKGTAWSYNKVFESVEPPVRAADEMMLAYLEEKKLEDTIRDKYGDVKEAVSEHMDSPVAQRLAARSGIPGYEFARGDFGRKTLEA